jgi:hypothetical protein
MSDPRIRRYLLALAHLALEFVPKPKLLPDSWRPLTANVRVAQGNLRFCDTLQLQHFSSKALFWKGNT